MIKNRKEKQRINTARINNKKNLKQKRRYQQIKTKPENKLPKAIR
jgi:hypothetical protein